MKWDLRSIKMQIKYFPDTDTLYITLNENEIEETKDLSEDVLIDLDKNGRLVAMTIEHARERANIENFSFQQSVAEVTI